MSDGQVNQGLDVSQLSPYQERQFVPADAVLTDAEVVTGMYEQLLGRAVETAEQLEGFVLGRSELEAALAQVQSVLYIRMTCQTDDAARAAAYQNYIETVQPVCQPLADKLDRKYVAAVDQLGVEGNRYDVYIRSIRSDIEIYRDENVPLQTEDALLSQQYQSVTGAMQVPFEGKEYTMPQMRTFLMETDRAVREGAWRATAERFLQDREQLDEIFGKMVAGRDQIGTNAGFANYRDYKFRAYHRFDYRPDDCRRYHESILKFVVPIQEKMMARRAEQMGLEKLRPWDLNVDALGQEAMKPFADTDEFIQGLYTMFSQLDAELGGIFKVMMDCRLLDLESRKGKAPGGYQSTLYEARKPFIFMNAVGMNDDLRVLMHEGGHAFHALLCAHDPLLAYRHAPIEFCEVASMSMEMMAASQLSICYNEAEQGRWWREQLETIVRILVSVAVNDAFQHWMYENPKHTADQRNAKWVELNEQYGSSYVDWTGLEEFRASQWHRILHLFQVPFYYIEYGIAQLGALGMWQQFAEDGPKAIALYKEALTVGGSLPLPALFEKAGLRFDFSAVTIEPLAKAVLAEWDKYR
jgi:oligoendopeptidase F